MRYKVLCGYIRQRWDCGDTVEIEEKHTGKYGARGQTREKKRKATPEEIKKHNQWKRERDVRRLIKWNFRERDYWITLTSSSMPALTRKSQYKNSEGYPDPTSGKAIKAAGHMPTHIYNAYTVLNNTAGLLGLEITGIRDKKTKKEWKRGG